MKQPIFARFSNGHIERNPNAPGVTTHAYWLCLVIESGEEISRYGFASNEDAAKRAAKNVKKRWITKTGELPTSAAVEVVSVGTEIKRLHNGNESFLKLLWRPKEMTNSMWDRNVGFKSRFLITGETRAAYFILICGVEYKISKLTMEILYRLADGKYAKGGPIFQRCE